MSTPDTETDLTAEQVLEILNRYHELARGNGTLELVAAELAGSGTYEILDEVIDVARDLGYQDLSDSARTKLRDALVVYGTRLAAEIEAAKLEAGDPVRIVGSIETRLGVVRQADDFGFVGTVRGMTEGKFRGRHPVEQLAGWVLVDVPVELVELAGDWTLDELGNPETLLVPVFAANVERVK